MRKQFVTTLETAMATDERIVTLLGDIGVFGFRNAFAQFPERIYNIGILEQATISVAAGLAKTGFIPTVHTIAPFLVERAYEQLKLDFGYQRLGGNFVSVGSSYDYAALGCTHHCPADVGVLAHIPGMEIVVPGTAAEFDRLFWAAYADGKPTYFRLSEAVNSVSYPVRFGKASVVQTGKKATVVVVGPLLDAVMEAAHDQDVAVIYYTTVQPFDGEVLTTIAANGKVLLVEPYYSGVMTDMIRAALYPKPLCLDALGIPHEFLYHYGTAADHTKAIGLTQTHIRSRLEKLINA